MNVNVLLTISPLISIINWRYFLIICLSLEEQGHGSDVILFRKKKEKKKKIPPYMSINTQ